MVAQDHAERLRVKLGFDGVFKVDSVGTKGGLALLWRTNGTASLLSYSKNHVDIEVTMPGFNKWRMTGYYGYAQRERWNDSWEFIRSLSHRSELPWVIIGDFNDLLYQYEKRGGNPHPEALLRGFGETIDECGLAQLPMQGYPFTWERGEGTVDWIEERLDKVLVTQEWRDMVVGEKGPVLRWPGSMMKAVEEWLRRHGRKEGTEVYKPVSSYAAQLEAQEDAFWRQRAKQHWLKGADANTKYYHRYASKNTISKIMNDDGDWVEGDAMRTTIFDYYRNIFSSNPSQIDESFYANVLPRVTHTQNEALLRPFEKDEVRTALFAMFPDKAPGPDGMNSGFYQQFWDVVGGDVSDFIVNCLNTRTFPTNLNDTDVVLIPKKKNPERVSDLRPIALSNVIYRVMAKMISARMKPLMDDIISDTQSAFIPDRLITDNILIAAEVGHFLNRKQCGRMGWGALKLDMAKAYDRMEWPFLRSMLTALGFNNIWVDLIMLCVTTVSYNIKLNGIRGSPIVPSRGLRQGDPLSPYLFIICAEGLSLLLQQAQEANAVKQCLTRYENLSGQVVNYHKSSICYSKNTQDDDRDAVAQILGVAQAPNFGKYLGLPSFIGRNKKAAFSYIEDKIRQRILSWNKKLLSQAGKEVLLKSVAQAMPTFSMSVFLLPMGICTAIERVMNRYWWGSGNERGIHWKAWDKMCIPKKYGGLGFKELHAFNIAMLGKQAWRFLTKPDSLVSRVYKARYYPKGTFYDAKIGNNPSFCWRSIMAAQSMVCGGIRRRIGNGKTTLIWDHPWMHDEHDPMIHTDKPPYLNNAAVVGLIDHETHTWDPDILTDIFNPADVARIKKIPVSPDYEDMWYWYDDQGDTNQIVHAAAILYHIWRARNGAVWDACLPRPRKVLALAKATILAWQRVHHTHHQVNHQAVVQCHITATAAAQQQRQHDTAGAQVTPEEAAHEVLRMETTEPVRKCYIDAGFMPASGKATVGAILLNEEGEYVSAFSAPLSNCLSPLMAETIACKEALSWLWNRGERSVCLLTDCLTLQQYLTSQVVTIRTYVGYAIDACRARITSFDYCSVNFIHRSENYLAHRLASSAFNSPTAMYSDDVPPDSISEYF
ncbi:PREDICTED: uncharacterized protein LOC109193678 [Ipomoea nil]|uniref:uncharacterized protein LOC109193678 n=1 Tax=Ipomoea nil TaxID=35883 RepID=UPI000900C7AE|nr:PREDICTED: uncharacterized protein LOC109193678 [Ipomoea nil]